MADPPKLDYATPEPRKRPRFLQKLNPKATWRSVVLKSVIYGVLAAAAWWLLRLNPRWHPDPWTFPIWVAAAAVVGAIREWQPIDL